MRQESRDSREKTGNEVLWIHALFTHEINGFGSFALVATKVVTKWLRGSVKAGLVIVLMATFAQSRCATLTRTTWQACPFAAATSKNWLRS